MAPKPISQNVTISDESAAYRMKVNSDGSINVNTGGGTTADVNLAEVGGVAVALGQGLMAASIPVAIASNQAWTGATGLGKAEDAVHGSGDVGIMALGVATDGSTALSAAGDYSVMGTDTAGNMRVVGSVASAATDSGNPVKVGGVYRATASTLTDGQRSDLITDTRQNLRVTLYGANSTNAVAQSNGGFDGNPTNLSAVYVLTYGLIYNGTTWDRLRLPSATSRIVSSAASTNATLGKNATGWLFAVTGYNSNAVVRYLKLYNKASAPTVGTDTPIMTIALVPSAGFAIDFPAPYYFSTGIAYALTTGSADADTGAVGAGDILGLNLAYS